jgi:hypothetical protein
VYLEDRYLRYVATAHRMREAQLVPVPANSGNDSFSGAIVLPRFRRRDGRVAEGARLESVFTRKGNVGSNPTLSAIFDV